MQSYLSPFLLLLWTPKKYLLALLLFRRVAEKNNMISIKNVSRKSLIKAAFFVLLIAIGYLSRTHQDSRFFSFLGVCLSFYAAIKLVMLFFSAMKSVKNINPREMNAHQADVLIKKSIPGWIVGYYEVEKLIYKNFFQVLTGRPELVGRNAFKLDIRQQSFFYRGLPFMLIALLGGLLFSVAKFFGNGFFLMMALGAVFLYGIIWFLGDWRGLENSFARVTDRGVDVNVGVRKIVSVPWNKIETISILNSNHSFSLESALRLPRAASKNNIYLKFIDGFHPSLISFGYEVPTKYNAMIIASISAAEFIDAIGIHSTVELSHT
ncbi:hypothetical protein [Duganella sp. BuS-21]|uniref:hypothetical protein n=1 Tax=Duganella sp. BuS-21 TaxID=2943848 RepID=UPI0035A5D79A